MTVNPAFQRLELLAGADAVSLLGKTRVIIFGLGGVGGWCAEALVRSGIRFLTIVDSDRVCVTNINRQVQATVGSIGKAKTAELRARLLAINSAARITELRTAFEATTADQFDLSAFDYVIDAIDSLSNKVELIIRAARAGARVFTALGASNRIDASRIRVGSLWKSHHCRLGKYVRKWLSQRGFTDEVLCVYSDEEREPYPAELVCGTGRCFCPDPGEDSLDAPAAREWCSAKKQINGSAVHITGTFGFMLAGLVVQDVVARASEGMPITAA